MVVPPDTQGLLAAFVSRRSLKIRFSCGRLFLLLLWALHSRQF
jgi:hypothetical protein